MTSNSIGGQAFVLKVAAASEPLADWRRKVHIQQLASNAGLAPRVVHVDETQRAVLSEFVVDRSFFAIYGDPRTREGALALLGRMIRRVHDLPLPAPAAHDGEPVSAIPARLAYDRRLVAVLCGTNFLNIARQTGHTGASGTETLDSALSLGEFYQRMRAGALNIASSEGQWNFGLALVKESFAL